MAPTDRYVFAKVLPTEMYDEITDVPAPDPADWQKVVEAVGQRDAHACWEAAFAAVRNMEARS